MRSRLWLLKTKRIARIPPGNFISVVPSMAVNLSDLAATTGVLPVLRGGTGLSAVGASGTFAKSDGSGFTWAGIAASDIASGILAAARGGFGADVSAVTGIAKFTGGTASFVAAPTGAIVGTSDSQTLSGKSISFATNTVSFTSAEARAACSDETGSGGAMVFATSPTINTPILTTPRVQTRLDIDNPAGTFQYQITPAALAANRILNLPLLLATDTVAVLAFAQTLTNKTMVAASNTITDTSAVAHDLFVHDGTRFARRAKGSDGTVLQYAAGALVASGIDFGSVTLSGQVPEARLSTTLGGLTSDVATTGRVTGIIRHGGAVVTQAGGSSNNQAVTNGKVRVTSSCAFTGFDATGMQDGDVIFVIVVGGVNPTIDHQSASSTAANRVITSSGATSTLIGDAVYMLYYDGTSSRWRTFQAAPMIP